MQTRPLTGALAKLADGPRVKTDMAYASSGIARGPHTGKKLVSAPWSAVWPAPGSTLDLDFSADRYWLRGHGQGGFAQAIAFSRASNGAFIGPDGLLKGLATNLIPAANSEFLSGWNTQGSITLGQSTEPPPVGTSTAVLTDTTSTSQHGRYYTHSVFATTYTFSVYLKKGSGASAPNWLQLGTGGARATWVNFNLTTLAVGISSGATGTITDVGNGWRRATLTLTVLSAGALYTFINFTNNTDANVLYPTYSGSTSSDVLIAAPQFEIGASATPYNLSSINVPRFDWASTTQVALKNRATSTESFGSTGQVTRVTITADSTATTAPDGKNTADLVVPTTASGDHGVAFFSNPLAGSTSVLSVYAKHASGSYRLSLCPTSSSIMASFNLENGTVPFNNSGQTTTITDVGNGWYRCSITVPANSTSVKVFVANASDAGNYVGDGTSGIYVWGLQHELGSTVTEYEPVAGSTLITPLAATPTCNGLLIESASTNWLLWCRDATSGPGTNMMLYSGRSTAWNEVNGTILSSSELVAGGNFENLTDVNAWTAAADGVITHSTSLVSGALRVTRTNGYGEARYSVPTTVGSVYKVTARCVGSDVGNRGLMSLGSTVGGADYTNNGNFTIDVGAGLVTIFFVATGTALHIRLMNAYNTLATWGEFDDVSVKEVVAGTVSDPVGGSTAAIATAASANATFTQYLVANAAVYTFSVWLRRKTGTGNVDITCNSSGTWVTQAITSSWARYSVTQSTTGIWARPGIRIVTAGDEVDVWGPQFTPGGVLTDYQATTTSALFGWSKTNMTAALDQTGIDGVANSATSLTATSDGATCVQSITASNASRHNSVYLKRLSGTGAVHVSADGVNWSAVDLSTSEWRRVSITQTLANPAFSIKLMTNGDAVAMDFAQVENEDQFRRLPSAPILTTLAAATRSAELANVRLFTDWYKEGEGTVVNVSNSGVVPPATKSGNTYQIGTGSADNNHTARHQHRNNLAAQAVTNAANASQVVITNNAIDPSVPPAELKTAFAFRYNSHAFAVKGFFVGFDTRWPVQRANQMNIGYAATAYYHEGTIKRITYYPKRFPDNALVALSGER